LRFFALRDVPGWASDEGSNIDIAYGLAQGKLEYFAIGHSSFINGHPHLFYLLLAGVYQLTDFDLSWARGLVALYGVITAVLLYIVTRRMFGTAVAFLATLIFAIYPRAVVYNRMAFTYNQLQPLYVMAYYLLWRYLKDHDCKWLIYVSLCVTAALVTDWAATSLLAILLIVVMVRSPRQLLWVLPLSLSALVVWGLVMWNASGQPFLDDLAFTLSRVGGRPFEQIARIVLLYPAVLEWDVWLFTGGLGLFLIPKRLQRALALALFYGSLLLTVRAGAASGIASYLLIPLFPFVALGLAIFISRIIPLLIREFEGDLDAALKGQSVLQLWPQGWRVIRPVMVGMAVFVMALSPLIAMLAEGLFLDYKLSTAHLAGTLADPTEAKSVANFVNANTSADDVVLASPSILWLFHAQVADFQQAVAITGRRTQHYPAGIPRDRFLFDCSLENANFVVLDPLWRGWASQMMLEVAQMVTEVETWPLALKAGDFEVYRNPAKQ
jgi:4-amino-4-deoxy-L-arabinose transferase-like glycosyltransferase